MRAILAIFIAALCATARNEDVNEQASLSSHDDLGPHPSPSPSAPPPPPPAPMQPSNWRNDAIDRCIDHCSYHQQKAMEHMHTAAGHLGEYHVTGSETSWKETQKAYEDIKRHQKQAKSYADEASRHAKKLGRFDAVQPWVAGADSMTQCTASATALLNEFHGDMVRANELREGGACANVVNGVKHAAGQRLQGGMMALSGGAAGFGEAWEHKTQREMHDSLRQAQQVRDALSDPKKPSSASGVLAGQQKQQQQGQQVKPAEKTPTEKSLQSLKEFSESHRKSLVELHSSLKQMHEYDGNTYENLRTESMRSHSKSDEHYEQAQTHLRAAQAAVKTFPVNSAHQELLKGAEVMMRGLRATRDGVKQHRDYVESKREQGAITPDADAGSTIKNLNQSFGHHGVAIKAFKDGNMGVVVAHSKKAHEWAHEARNEASLSQSIQSGSDRFE